MKPREFSSFKMVFLDNYKREYSKLNNNEKRLLRNRIEKNINLTKNQKEEFWNLICRGN